MKVLRIPGQGLRRRAGYVRDAELKATSKAKTLERKVQRKFPALARFKAAAFLLARLHMHPTTLFLIDVASLSGKRIESTCTSKLT